MEGGGGMIEFQDVSFSYPDSPEVGLKHIDLTIPDGQCVLLCGRSGCGKTTLTRLVNGLIPQFFAGELSGKVLLDGEDLADLPMYRIAERVGSVFQNPRTQFFNMDADSEIVFSMENEAVPRERMERRVAETAGALHIENLLGRNIFALSSGEKQKIAFASVYAMEPDIYLLDEPSSNLDMTAIHDLREHLRLIKAQGKTVVVAEHRLYYLMDVADRVIYLENGRVAGDWTPEQFRTLPPEMRRSMGLRAVDLRKEWSGGFPASGAAPALELQNVTLSYQKRPVLRDISLKAAPGEVIAVVGYNGAGKTTFARALCGLHREASGLYLWNGKPQKPKERMRRAYLVMQDVNYQLFAESVAAECVFGIRRPDTVLAEKTLEELGLAPFRERHPNTLSGGQKQRLAAATAMVCGKELLVFDEPTSGLDFDSMARLAALPIGGLLLKNGTLTGEKFVLIVILSMGLEKGFNTVVGSGGGHLSGGEKQRISIARAMLKNAPIVILDEATAYTDPENEAVIQESVARLVRGRTLIVIAHRLSTIVDADQIAVVNGGRIETAGTQAELLERCPLYQTLWSAHIASRDSGEGGAERA